jgi:hypothetical protein
MLAYFAMYRRDLRQRSVLRSASALGDPGAAQR